MPGAENPQSLNRFSYARNNPINRIDPSGHVDCEKGTEGGTCQSATQEERRQAQACADIPGWCEPPFKVYIDLEAIVETGKDAASLNDLADVALTGEKCLRGQCNGLDVVGAALPFVSGRLLRKIGEGVGWLAKKIFGWSDEAAAVVLRTIDDIPSMGSPGKQPNVRVLTGDVKDARSLFDELSASALEIKPIKDGGLVANLGEGRFVTFRPVSSHLSNYVPTVYANAPGIGYWEVKFEP